MWARNARPERALTGLAVEEDLSCGLRVEAGEQTSDRRLARSGLADEGDDAARRSAQRLTSSTACTSRRERPRARKCLVRWRASNVTAPRSLPEGRDVGSGSSLMGSWSSSRMRGRGPVRGAGRLRPRGGVQPPAGCSFVRINEACGPVGCGDAYGSSSVGQPT